MPSETSWLARYGDAVAVSKDTLRRIGNAIHGGKGADKPCMRRPQQNEQAELGFGERAPAEHRFVARGPQQLVCTYCGIVVERDLRDELTDLKTAARAAETHLLEQTESGTWQDTDRCYKCRDATLHEFVVLGVEMMPFVIAGQALQKKCRTVLMRCTVCGTQTHDFQL
jgi:hypothetical protein